MHRSPVWILTLVLFAGCDASATAEDSESLSGPRWEAVVEQRVGSIDGPDDALSPVGTVLLGPEGEMFVSQRMEASIRVFSEDGRPAGIIGGRGDGPGELDRLGPIGLTGDTLYAMSSSRTHFFSTSGELFSTEPYGPESFSIGSVSFHPRSPSTLVRRSDGTALVRPGIATALAPPSGEIMRMSHSVPYLLVDGGAQVVDTIAWGVLEGATIILTRGGSTFFLSSPFSDAPLAEVMPDGTGVVTVDRRAAGTPERSTFRVTLAGPAGDTVFSSVLPYDPLAASDEWVTRRIAATVVSPRGQAEEPAVGAWERALRDEGLIPSHMAPVTDVVPTQDGIVWIRREDAGGGTGGDAGDGAGGGTGGDAGDGAGDAAGGAAVLWQAIDGSGRLAGSLTLPSNQTVVASRGDIMVALELDDLDVPYLVRYRLNRND